MKNGNKGLTYIDIFNYDIFLMNFALYKYEDSEKAWEVFCKDYKDPDGYPLEPHKFETIDGIKCTYDTLLSIKRIKEHEGFNSNFRNTFRTYRTKPIFFFPCEVGGINTARYNKFYDRIDHMLFDLKRKCEGKTDCKLEDAYNRPMTKKWLEHFNYDFNKIVEWYGLNYAFVKKVDGEYKVIDLEKNDGTYINDYSSKYLKSWTKNYYNNIKKKMDIWYRNQV